MLTQPRASHCRHSGPLSLLCAVALATILCGCQSDRTPPRAAPVPLTDTVTLLSWNVDNFFDLVDNGNEYPEYKPNTHGWDQFTFQVKLQNTAAVIAAVRPDIAVLCETENENVVQQLIAALGQRGVTYGYYALADQPAVTLTMPAIISRFPIVAHRGIGTVNVGGFDSRNILEADLLLGVDTLKVFVCHWPSKKHGESFRLAAAEALRERLASLRPGIDYVIVGDLNSDYNECETFHSAGLDDTHGRTGLNHVLGTVKSQPCRFVDFVHEADLTQSDTLRHYDLWLELPEARRGSYMHTGAWGTLDHMLLPAALYDTAGVSYVDNSFRVITLDGKLLKNGAPYVWQMRYGKQGQYHAGEGYSDHLPIAARFRCGRFAPTQGLDSVAHPRLTDSLVVSFETGVEGWIAGQSGVHLTRDTSTAAAGLYSLKIAGSTHSSNDAIALTRIPACRIGAAPKRLTLSLRGSAVFSIRVRQAEAKKWRYFNAPAFGEPSGSAKYVASDIPSWKKLTLDIAGIVGRGEDVEIELRAGKKSRVEMWLDEIRLE